MRNEPRNRRFPWRSLWWSIAAVVLLVCFVSAFLWHRQRAAERAVQAALEAVRAAGEPVSVDDFRSLHEQLPGDRETAQLWIEGFDLLAKAPLNKAEMNLPIVGWGTESPLGTDWDQLQVAEQYLANRAEAFKMLHLAASRELPGRFEFNFDPLGMSPPLAPDARHAARALALEARISLHRNEPDDAAASSHVIFMLSRSLNSKFELTDLFVRIAIDSMARQTAQQIAQVGGAPSASLGKLQKDLRLCDYQDGLRVALLAERVYGIMMFERLSLEPFVASGGRSWIRTSQQDFAEYLDEMKKLVQATELPWKDALAISETIAQEASGHQISFFNQTLDSFSSLSLQNVEGYFSAVCKNVCGNRLCDAGLAVERYRIEHGELPEMLDQLVPEFMPEVPIDPYSSEPLRYSIEENGYVVYSVGPDGVDDVGKSDDSGGPDLVFRVSRPIVEWGRIRIRTSSEGERATPLRK